MKKIAVLITCYNRKNKTIECLLRLFSQNGFLERFEIYVYLTNDGSTDGTSEAIADQFPQVTIINGDGSLFWNHGMIKAWRVAAPSDYDFYLWLNDDVKLYNDAIERLLFESEKHLNKAIIGGSMCSYEGDTIVSYGGRINRHHLIQDVSQPVSCNTLSGNLVLIPRYVYQIVGMNDPLFRHAGGDLDYCLRAKTLGVEVCLASGIYGVCPREDSMPKWANPQVGIRERFSNMFSIKGNNPNINFIFNKRHYGLFNAVCRYVIDLLHVTFPQIWIKRRDYIKQKHE